MINSDPKQKIQSQKPNLKKVGQFAYDKNYILGVGSFGFVFKGYNREKRDEVVAVKVLDKMKLTSIFLITS